MSDTTDNITICYTIDSLAFQERCRLRFINAAISVMTEVVQLTANAPTPSGSNILHFVNTVGISQLMTISDLFGAVIPFNALVTGTTATSVTMNGSITGTVGVSIGDIISFAPVSHVQRAAFAGALFANNVDLKMLAMVILANATNRSNCLANATVAGGNILDNDIDFTVNSTFTGIATSRNW